RTHADLSNVVAHCSRGLTGSRPNPPASAPLLLTLRSTTDPAPVPATIAAGEDFAFLCYREEPARPVRVGCQVQDNALPETGADLLPCEIRLCRLHEAAPHDEGVDRSIG